MDDQEIAKLARGAARIGLQAILTVPPIVRIEAAFMLVRAIIQSDVKPHAQLDVFNEYVEKLRDHIVNDPNEEAGHGPPESNNE